MTHRSRQILSCSLCLVLAFAFCAMGLAKLAAPAAAQQAFVRWGFPDWFHLLVGSVEVFGALLLVFRRTTTLAAAILGGVMLGAVATHIHEGEFMNAILPAALVLPIAAVGFCRRLEAGWMRRLSRRENLSPQEHEHLARLAIEADDASIVPGMPEILVASHSQSTDARHVEHQRRA